MLGSCSKALKSYNNNRYFFYIAAFLSLSKSISQWLYIRKNNTHYCTSECFLPFSSWWSSSTRLLISPGSTVHRSLLQRKPFFNSVLSCPDAAVNVSYNDLEILCQIFFHLAQPNSVNKHFHPWLLPCPFLPFFFLHTSSQAMQLFPALLLMPLLMAWWHMNSIRNGSHEQVKCTVFQQKCALAEWVV